MSLFLLTSNCQQRRGKQAWFLAACIILEWKFLTCF